MAPIDLNVQKIDTEDKYTYTNTVGLKIVLDTKLDLSDISAAIIKCRKPDKTIESWSAEVDPDKTCIYHVTQTGDLDQEGDYELQAYIEYSDGSHFYGDVAVLTVKKHI